MLYHVELMVVQFPTLFLPCICSMTHLQSTVRRRLQSVKMNTKLVADRWSSHLSVLTLLQTVNVTLFICIASTPFPLPFLGSLLFLTLWQIQASHPSFYCLTLRPQCNGLLPRLDAFPVVNPLWSENILCHFVLIHWFAVKFSFSFATNFWTEHFCLDNTIFITLIWYGNILCWCAIKKRLTQGRVTICLIGWGG